MAVVAVCACTALPSARPVGADQVSADQAKAAQIEATLNAAQNKLYALSQQYDQYQNQLSAVKTQITATQAQINADRQKVSSDRVILAKAATNAYVNDGEAATENPLFATNQNALASQEQYNQVAEGDVSADVDNLHAAENDLNTQENALGAQEATKTEDVSESAQAVAANQAAVASQRSALAEENSQIAVAKIVEAQQAAQAKAAAAAAQAKIQQAASAAQAGHSSSGQSTSSSYTAAPPPTASGGAGAVQAAESQIGVPYVWGAETPRGNGTSGAFDCSGLTAWSWGQVGVPLPHFSGAQMSDSAPVPLNDLQPGDLLFYGPGGDTHVAMYVGPGTMIEAPYTGANVRLTGLRLTGNFAGAGRP